MMNIKILIIDFLYIRKISYKNFSCIPKYWEKISHNGKNKAILKIANVLYNYYIENVDSFTDKECLEYIKNAILYLNCVKEMYNLDNLYYLKQNDLGEYIVGNNLQNINNRSYVKAVVIWIKYCFFQIEENSFVFTEEKIKSIYSILENICQPNLPEVDYLFVERKTNRIISSIVTS